MSIFDRLRKNATRVVDQHGDRISAGLDKAAKVVDERTGRKHSTQIRKGVAKAKEGLDRLDQRNDGDLGGPGRPPGDGPRPPR